MPRFAIGTFVALQLLIGIVSAPAQDNLAEQTRALAIISDTADRLCYTLKQKAEQQKLNLAGEAQAELSGILAKFAALGVKGNAELKTEEYQGVVREQLASALRDSQDCKRDVFKVLVDRILPAKVQTASNGRSVERLEADVSYNCRRLQFWPKAQVPIDDVIKQLERLSQEAADQDRSANIPSRTLALLNRCMGAAYLISNKDGLLDKVRDAIPYLDRSLAFGPDQLLLRQNTAYFDQFINTGKTNIYALFTNMIQVLRGSDDPDISDLAKEMGDWAIKYKAKN